MPTYAPDNSSYVIDEAENEYMWLVVVATDDNDTITHFSNACGVAKVTASLPLVKIFLPRTG